MATNNDLVNRAWEFATEYHWGQLYGKEPYIKHLRDVYKICLCQNAPTEVLVAAILHDVIEDTDATFEIVANEFNYNIATLVYSVTDEDADNRRDRKLKTYPKHLCHPFGIMVKLADRIANIEHCTECGNKDLFKMYKNEHKKFETLHKVSSGCDAMWIRLQDAVLQA